MPALVDNYSEKELRDIIKSSCTMAEVIKKLGYKTVNGSNHITVKKRIEKYNISTSHFQYCPPEKRTFENIFCINSTASQHVVRTWFKRISDDSICEICGQQKTWNNKPLIMILDHKNQDTHDHRIINLRWICPNCWSQLPQFTGKNNANREHYKSVVSLKRRKKICPVCNFNEINVASKQCRECFLKERRKKIPKKEELEKVIYQKSFVQIGKQYGVTDNAVRKWCKQYGLPYRYGELHHQDIRAD